MRNGNIFSIAAQLGWTASAQYKEGRLFFDFHRKTLSGVPFTFTAEMKDGKVSNLVKEIESFVDAPFIGVDPDKRQRSLGIVDVVVDGTSVHPEVKAGFLDHYQWNMLLLGCHAQREQEGV